MHNKLIFVLLMFISINLCAQEKIPLMEKKRASVGQSISTDGSSEYGNVTPSLRLTNTFSLTDDFSDGNYNGWTVSSGAYAVDTLTNPLSSNRYNLKCTTAGIISIPCNQAYGKWKFQLYKGADANASYVNFISPDISATTHYRLEFTTTERTIISRSTVNILSSATSYIANNTYYEITIERNTNGQFYTYIQGGVFTTKTLVSVSGGSGTNPVTDNTYTSSNYFVLDLDAGDRITNISCEYGEGSLDLNGYARIKHSDDRDFEGSNVTWVGHGNHSIARSTTDKHAGSYSLAMTSTDVGDATTNYIELPATSFNTIEAGKKYTKEIWARGTNANCKITLAIGNQSKQSATLSTVSGAFTKVVFNFLATASEVGQPIKIYANQADVVYLDDVSLTQAWDVLMNVWGKTSASTDVVLLSNLTGGSASSKGWTYMLTGSGTTRHYFWGADGGAVFKTSTPANTTTQGNNGLWHQFSLLVDRLGYAYLYKDGSLLSTTALTFGNANSSSALYVGRYSYAASNYWNGFIGEVQIVRFTDISTSNVNANTLLQAYKQGLGTWANGQVVAWYKWRGNSDSQMLQDISGNGNNLTGVNLTTADQERGNYPSK